MKVGGKIARLYAGVWTVVGKPSAVAIPNTGDTNENTLATVTVPGGSMGPNGILRISSLWSAGANNANTKTCRVRFNANQMAGISLASALSLQDIRWMHNRNSLASQVAFGGGSAFTAASSAPFTLASNTALDRNITFTAQLGVGTDTITLEAYLVELLYGA